MSAPTIFEPTTWSSPSPGDEPHDQPPRRRSRWQWVVAAITVPVLLAGFGLWWFVLKGDAPAAVSLDQALSGIQAPADSGAGSGAGTAVAAPATSAATTGTTLPAAVAAVQGSWTIDRTITNSQGTGTFGGFRIDERLVGIGATTAVGRTPTLRGSLTVSGTTLRAAEINVDLTDITTNDGRRDDAVQRALGTSRYPDATFVLTNPVDVGSVPAEGQRISVKATGDLTIHGVTKNVTIDLDAQVQGGVLVVVGSTQILLSDYGVTAPTAPIVASVSNTATMEFQLYFTKA